MKYFIIQGMAFLSFGKSIKSNFEKKNPPLWTLNHFTRFLKMWILYKNAAFSYLSSK